LAQRPDLAAQLAQLLALVLRQPLARAAVDLGLPHPGPQRLIGDPEVLGKNPQGLVATAGELHGFGLEFRRVDRAGVGHGNTSSRAPKAQ
jgi:hypothetical protein